jgi:hypothetical protein
MKTGGPEYVPIMVLRPIFSFTTVVVTVTGMTTMPVLINEKRRML